MTRRRRLRRNSSNVVLGMGMIMFGGFLLLCTLMLFLMPAVPGTFRKDPDPYGAQWVEFVDPKTGTLMKTTRFMNQDGRRALVDGAQVTVILDDTPTRGSALVHSPRRWALFLVPSGLFLILLGMMLVGPVLPPRSPVVVR